MNETTFDIAKMIDHTILKPEATISDLEKACRVAVIYGAAALCVRPSDVKAAKVFLGGSGMKIATVVGFPHGNTDAPVKVFEAESAINNGAEEIDMVMNFGRFLSGESGYVADEIKAVTKVVHDHGKTIKIIFETCYLSKELIIEACKICNDALVDFVKTSTGFGTRGASFEDIITMREYCSPAVRIKASGGIKTLNDVLEMRRLGAARIGTSSTEVIMEEGVRIYGSNKTGSLSPL